MKTSLKFRLLYTLILFAYIPPVTSAQSITVPDKVYVDQPGLIVIRATQIDADDVRWYSIGPGMQTFPPDVVTPKVGVYLGMALKEGTYKLGVICAKSVNGKAVISLPQEIQVTVGNPGPPPPPPPPPNDPLAFSIQQAYTADTGATKAQDIKNLAGLYRQAVGWTGTNTTWGSLFQTMAAASQTIGLTDKLVGVRTALQTEMKSKLPTDGNKPLDDAGKALASSLFTRIAGILDGVH